MKKVKIAIAGHANTGKTTLVRNLVRQKIGEVMDKAGSTTKTEKIEHYSVFTEIADCPGFQESGIIFREISKGKSLENIREELANDNLEEDFDAVETIQNADVVFYVISLDSVVERGHNSEINLIKKVCPNVIGIINKYGNSNQGDSGLKINRLSLWESFFKQHEITFIQYDFHWDSPRKINSLFDATRLFLESKEKEIFDESLKSFNSQSQKDYEKISNSATDFIKKISKIKHEIVYKDNQEYQEKSKEIQEKIFNETRLYLIDYIKVLTGVYKLTYNPDETKISFSKVDEVLQSITSKKIDGVIGGAIAGGAGGTVLGTALGVSAGFKALILGMAFGPAFIATAAIGGIIGTIWGATAGGKEATSPTMKSEFKFLEADLINISALLIAITWAYAFQGFGMSDTVSNERVEKLLKEDVYPLLQEHKLKINIASDVDLKAYSETLKAIFISIHL